MTHHSLHHLAQINIARWSVDPSSYAAFEFTSNLARINELAEQSPDFVWRLKDEAGTSAISLATPWSQDVIANLTLWQDLESLRHFTYKTDHRNFIKKRRAWFDELEGPHMALWWIEAGTLPDLAAAKTRLDHLETHGPTPHAFTFNKAFDPSEKPAEKRPVRGWAVALPGQ